MRLDNEDLLAISQVFDVRLDLRLKPLEEDIQSVKGEIQSMKGEINSIKGEIQSMKGEIHSIKGEIQSMKGEIQSMKGEIHSMKGEIQSIKSEIHSIKGEIHSVKDEFQSIKAEMRSMKNDFHQIKLCQENDILPRLNTIESCYLDTFERYKNHADKIEVVYEDVVLLKKVVMEHSEKFNNSRSIIVPIHSNSADDNLS